MSRELAPGEFGAVTVGAIKVGTAPDVIIDRAELLLNVCAYCPAVFPAGYAVVGTTNATFRR